MAAAERTSKSLNATSGRVDQLIALFNKKGMDLPEGLFDRTTQFLLNGAPYETLLGQSSADPLILMLTRGPAGYRFIVKAVQHAVPDAVIQRGELNWSHDDGQGCHVDLWLSGHLRGSGDAINAMIRVVLSLAADNRVRAAAVTLDEAALDSLRAARRRP